MKRWRYEKVDLTYQVYNENDHLICFFMDEETARLVSLVPEMEKMARQINNNPAIMIQVHTNNSSINAYNALEGLRTANLVVKGGQNIKNLKRKARRKGRDRKTD